MIEELLAKISLGAAKFITSLSSKELWKKCQNIRFGDFLWEPKDELKNSGNFKNIYHYPQNIKNTFELKDNDLVIVKGLESFEQDLCTYIHSEREQQPYTGKEYGNEQSHSIFIEKNYEEYCRQCKYMSEGILKHTTFKDYIQQIYSICRKKDKLVIKLKVYGKPDTLTCNIPFLVNKKEHKKRLQEYTEKMKNSKIVPNLEKEVITETKVITLDDIKRS